MTSNLLNMPVPLVGQPVQVTGYTVIVLAECGCGAKSSFQILAQMGSHTPPQRTLGTCGACGRKFTIQNVGFDTNAGGLTFQLEMSDTPPEAAKILQ